MGFNNPSWTWSELEAALSGRSGRDGRAPGSPSWNAGGDGPAWSRRRQPFEASHHAASPGCGALRRAALPLQLLVPRRRLAPRGAGRRGRPPRPRGARPHRPRRLLRRRPLRRGGPGGRAADRVRHRDHARRPASPTTQRVVRAEDDTLAQVDTGQRPRRHAPDPHGEHLVLLADGPTGYARLARALSLGHLAGEKGAPQFTLADVADDTARRTVWVLTGCRKGAVPRGAGRRRPGGRRAASCSGWSSAFGRDRVLVELWDHGDPLDSARNDALAELAARDGVELRRHHQRPLRHARPAPAGHRARRRAGPPQPRRARPVAAGGRRRPPALGRRAGTPLRPLPRRRRAGGRDRPGGGVRPVARRPEPAAVPVPAPTASDRDAVPAPLVEDGGAPLRRAPVTRETRRCAPGVATRSTTSSTIIEQLGFPGYFLVVWDLVEFCRRDDIFCQGRGSAANSAVCYALGITNADAVSLGLLFERFLSPERDGPPDIDIDIESDRREEVIQYVYAAPRPAPHRAGRQRHHLPRPLGGARHGQGARLRARPAGRVVASRSTVGHVSAVDRRASADCSIPDAGARPRRRDRGRARATSASTPAGW